MTTPNDEGGLQFADPAPADELQFDEPPAAAPVAVPGRPARRGLWGALVAAGALLGKFKAVVFLLLSKAKFVLVALKGGKFFVTGLSMLASMWAQAMIHGWKFAVGFVALIFVHEMGHVWMARRQGLPVSAPVFIPFVGALITMKKMPKDAAMEAAVAIGGPFIGSLGALACLLAYYATGIPVLLPLAYFGFFINLFNLVPVSPLDGGRIVTAISPRIWWIGLPILLLLAIGSANPIIILVLIFGVIRALGMRKQSAYYDVPDSVRRYYGMAYVGLLLGVGLLTYLTHGAAMVTVM